MTSTFLSERVLHLPQELRDMIYSHFWDEQTVHALQLPQLIESGGTSNKIPQIADKKIVGEQIAAEAVDWLYNNSLHLTVNHPSGLPEFLSDDIFGTGVYAGACTLHRLTIEITDLACDVSCLQVLTTAKLRDNFQLHIRLCLGSKNIQGIVHLGVRLAELPIAATAVVVVAEDVGPWDVTDLMGEPYSVWKDALDSLLQSRTDRQTQRFANRATIALAMEDFGVRIRAIGDQRTRCRCTVL